MSGGGGIVPGYRQTLLCTRVGYPTDTCIPDTYLPHVALPEVILKRERGCSVALCKTCRIL